MSPIRVVIADDEAPARAKVRRLLQDHPDLELVGEAASGGDTLELVRTERPDLLLLDVRMPSPDGLDVMRTLQESDTRVPHVVFLTAHDAYAVEAFEVHAVDYLMKPFDAERFERAIVRARATIERGAAEAEGALARALEALRSPDPPLEHLVVEKGRRSILLRTSEVDRIEAARNYVILHAGEASYIVRGTLRELEARLDPRRFVRIHRSHIVNLDRIRELHPWSHGDLQVVLTDGTRLTLSRRYRDRLPSLGSRGG